MIEYIPCLRYLILYWHLFIMHHVISAIMEWFGESFANLTKNLNSLPDYFLVKKNSWYSVFFSSDFILYSIALIFHTVFCIYCNKSTMNSIIFKRRWLESLYLVNRTMICVKNPIKTSSNYKWILFSIT